MRPTPTDNPYTGIFHMKGEDRPVMSHPPRFTATKKLIRTIEDAQRDNPTPEGFADWLANYLEGYGALFARPVFDMDGNGPECSWCRQIWPLCGHHHMSAECADEGDPT